MPACSNYCGVDAETIIGISSPFDRRADLVDAPCCRPIGLFCYESLTLPVGRSLGGLAVLELAVILSYDASRPTRSLHIRIRSFHGWSDVNKSTRWRSLTARDMLLLLSSTASNDAVNRPTPVSVVAQRCRHRRRRWYIVMGRYAISLQAFQHSVLHRRIIRRHHVDTSRQLGFYFILTVATKASSVARWS